METENRMRLSIGATIRCRDGLAGRLKYVVIDPDDGKVTNLIVERGKLLRRDIVVPAAWVERETEGEIVLNATVEDLKTLPEYKEFEFLEPDRTYRPLSGHRVEDTRIWMTPYHQIGGGRPWILRRVRMGINDDEVILQRGLPVHAEDGHTVGVVDHLVVEADSRRVTHLVVQQGRFWDRRAHIVPLDRVVAVTEYGVRLNMTAEELDQEPLYQTPASDAQITASLQRALDTDPRTRAAGLRVEVKDGVARFIGNMSDAVKDTAREIAEGIRGVIGFVDDINELVVPPFPPLRIGAPVYARDGSYGELHKIVVDPHARRVTHMVLHKGGLLAEDRVIPIERIERIDLDGIYLNGDAGELNQYPAYREEVFVEPLKGWEALEPYAAANTLFWGGPYIGVAPPVLPVIEHVVPQGVPENEIVLRPGADVIYNGELVGSLDHLLFNRRGGTVTHLVVKAYESGRRVFVPAEWIGELVGNAITLNHWEPDRPGVPIYEGSPDDAEKLKEYTDHRDRVA